MRPRRRFVLTCDKVRRWFAGLTSHLGGGITHSGKTLAARSGRRAQRAAGAPGGSCVSTGTRLDADAQVGRSNSRNRPGAVGQARQLNDSGHWKLPFVVRPGIKVSDRWNCPPWQYLGPRTRTFAPFRSLAALRSRRRHLQRSHPSLINAITSCQTRRAPYVRSMPRRL